MNQLNNLVNTGEPTMSSLEISELVESRHDKVKQSIERLAKRGVINISQWRDLCRLGVSIQLPSHSFYFEEINYEQNSY